MQITDQSGNKRRRLRKFTDQFFLTIFRICGGIAALMIVLIFVFVLQRGVQVFLPNYEYGKIGLWDFLTGMTWRQDQDIYGLAFIVVNTISTAIFAGLISFPLAVLTALFIVKIVPKRIRQIFVTTVELLAAIPSVVYGVFASGVITQLVVNIAAIFGYTTKGGISSLSVIILLAIMIFPTICSLSISAISAVDHNLELGSLALGASQTQTNFKVVLTAAKSGIFAGLILGLGRAFGEATAVSMVAGNAMTGPTWNLFDTTRTLTSTMLAGMHETSGADYDIRFSVGIVLMIVILFTNWIIHIVRKRVGGVSNG